jgi:hypothetical protein
LRRFYLLRKLGTVSTTVPKYACNPFCLIRCIVFEVVFLSRRKLLVSHDSLQVSGSHARIG